MSNIDRILKNFDKKSGRYFAADKLMEDLTNFWGQDSLSRRNFFFHNRPEIVKTSAEIYHLYVLVEYFDGFDLIENDVDRWIFIASELQKFSKSNKSINSIEMCSFYKKVILPCVKLAESSAWQKKLNSPWKTPKNSVERVIADLFDVEISQNSFNKIWSPSPVAETNFSPLIPSKKVKSRRKLRFDEKIRCEKENIRILHRKKRKPTILEKKFVVDGKENESKNCPTTKNDENSSEKINIRRNSNEISYSMSPVGPTWVPCQLFNSLSNNSQLIYLPVPLAGTAYRVQFSAEFQRKIFFQTNF